MPAYHAGTGTIAPLYPYIMVV